eukprot:6212157-Pleurochrysis_carterae.AAC.2
MPVICAQQLCRNGNVGRQHPQMELQRTGLQGQSKLQDLLTTWRNADKLGCLETDDSNEQLFHKAHSTTHNMTEFGRACVQAAVHLSVCLGTVQSSFCACLAFCRTRGVMEHGIHRNIEDVRVFAFELTSANHIRVLATGACTKCARTQKRADRHVASELVRMMHTCAGD